jgi:hypothetical protein
MTIAEFRDLTEGDKRSLEYMTDKALSEGKEVMYWLSKDTPHVTQPKYMYTGKALHLLKHCI